MGNTIVMPQDLEIFCYEAMRWYGLRDVDALLSAKIFVAIDTWGTHTHGTRQLRNLLKNFPIGRLDTQAKAEIVSEGLGWALIDGHNAMPPVTASRAMQVAIDKAKICGIAYTSVRHSSHFGAAGYYVNQAAEQDMIGLVMCNTDPQMTVPGAKGKVLGTNPIAYAFPAGNYKSVFLDIATSAVAANKVIRASALGEQIPLGWLVDGEGTPTTNPEFFPEQGALMPMAAHKGYGLAVLVEVLCGVLAGASLTRQQVSWVPGSPGTSDEPVNQGQLFMAIDPATVMPLQEFKQRMDSLIEYFHNAPKAKGEDRVYLPGEMEWERRRIALAEGINLPSDVTDSLRILAEDIGLTVFPTWLNE